MNEVDLESKIEELLADAREVTDMLDKVSRRSSMNTLIICVTAVTLVALLVAAIVLV